MAVRSIYRSVYYDEVTGLFHYLLPGGKFVTIGASPVTPPTDGNIYPLQMQPVATPGATVDLGTGPDVLSLLLACSPGTPDGQRNVVAVLLGDKVIAAPLTVSSTSGMSGGQIFNIHGVFGVPPLTVSLASGNAEAGLTNLWINGVSMDFLPLVYNGPSVDARGAKPPPNATTLWDNIGAPVTFSTERVAVTPPPPTPTLTIVRGAKIDGVIVPDATLADLEAATPAGSVLTLPAGTIFGTTVMGANTIEGAGQGQTIIDCTGLTPTFGKAVFVPTASGAVLRDLTIRGAAGPDNNAAGVRQQGSGIDFTMERVEVTACQDGILTFPGNVRLVDCYTHGNGAGDGFSHEVYLGGDVTSTATLINHRSVCGAGATHALKSRCGTTVVTGGSFTGSSDTTGHIGGSVVDIPDGGVLTMTGAAVIMGVGAAQHELIGYALESAKNGLSPVTLTGVALQDSSGEGGFIHSGQASAALVIDAGSTYAAGTKAPQLIGWGSVTGAFSPA